MAINCNEIDQTVNQLLAAWGNNCKDIKPSDLTLLVELVAAVQVCANGGTAYDYLHTDIYEPETDTIVSYDTGEYHSISVMVVEGNITLTDGTLTTTLPQGSVLDHEVTNLNQLPFRFTVKAGAKVTVQYLNAIP